MERAQEKDRKRRQAAATCQRLDSFLVPNRARDQLVTPDPDFTQLVAVDDQLTPTSGECCSDSVKRVGSSSTATYVESLRNTCCEVYENEAQRVAVAGGNQQCHHANTSDHDLVDDIGKLFFKAKSPVDFCKSMQALGAAEKYNLLTNHKKPRADQVFPPTCIGGRNRAFRPVWLSEHPWMVYSEQVDGVFCIACGIFVAKVSKGKFVCKPFVIGTRKEKNQRSTGSAYTIIKPLSKLMTSSEPWRIQILPLLHSRTPAGRPMSRVIVLS